MSKYQVRDVNCTVTWSDELDKCEKVEYFAITNANSFDSEIVVTLDKEPTYDSELVITLDKEPAYETHLWLRLETPDGRIVESPEPEGDGWEREGVLFVSPAIPITKETDTKSSACFADEYRKMAYIKDRSSAATILDCYRYKRPIPQPEHYDVKYPLMAQYLGG